MQPVNFPGSEEIKKPLSMTDEQCMSIPAFHGFDQDGFPFFLTAWKPSYEDLQAIPAFHGFDQDGFPFFLTAWKPSYEDLQALNRGEPVYVKTITRKLPPMLLFTLDEDQYIN